MALEFKKIGKSSFNRYNVPNSEKQKGSKYYLENYY